MSEETEIIKTEEDINEQDLKNVMNKFVSEMCGLRSHLQDQAVAIKILCAIPLVGAFEEEISKFFGYSGGKDKQIRRLFNKAVEVGIIEPIDDSSFYFHVKWMDEKMDEDHRSISMILDSMCITGDVKRMKTDGGDYMYENIRKVDGRSILARKYVSFPES